MTKTVAGKPRINNRMQSIECFRLIASMLVVFIHCESSGNFGFVMNCLARVAVPFFFIVSGYFAFNASEKAIRKRLWSAVKLTVIAHLLYLLWEGYLRGIRDLGSLLEWSIDKCSSNSLMIMLLINKSPIKGHLWYLNAIVLCYAAIWIYVRWSENETCNYKPLYITGVLLYSIHVVLSSFATACGLDIPYHMYRNALLCGIPMFSLGIFLREYHAKIIRAYDLTKIKLAAAVAAGAFLSVIQWKGTGNVEMPVGTLVEVIALMLLLVSVPVVSKNSVFISGIISTFGSLSTYIYITHMAWANIYDMCFKEFVLRMGEAAEAFLYPFSVLGLTLITGVLYMVIKAAWKWLWGKMKLVIKC